MVPPHLYAAGTATIVISVDLDEIRTISDRIAGMYKGKIRRTVDRRKATTEKLDLLMAEVFITA